MDPALDKTVLDIKCSIASLYNMEKVEKNLKTHFNNGNELTRNVSVCPMKYLILLKSSLS